MTLSSNHVLFLGSARFMQRAFASRQNVFTSLIAPDERPADRAHLVYRRAITPSDVREAAKVIHGLHPVTHLACFDDRFQSLAAEIAELLHLPFHAPSTVAAVQHKGSMRAVLHGAGLDDTPYRSVHTEMELRQFAASVGYPLILKPADGLGSEGVGVIQHEESLAKHWRRTRLAAPGELLAEKFLQGEEFSVEGFTYCGKHTLLAITRKHTDPVNTLEVSHQLPAELPHRTSDSIRTFVERVLTALNIQYGPTHTEIIVTPHGPRLVETHLRLGGGFIPELIQDIGGPDLFELTARQVFGRLDAEDVAQLRAFEGQCHELYAAVYFRYALVGHATPSVVGRFRGLEHLETVQARPGVKAAGALVSPGSTVQAAQSTKDRLAYCRAVAPSAELAYQRAANAANALGVLIELHGTTVDEQEATPEVAL